MSAVILLMDARIAQGVTAFERCSNEFARGSYDVLNDCLSHLLAQQPVVTQEIRLDVLSGSVFLPLLPVELTSEQIEDVSPLGWADDYWMGLEVDYSCR